MTKKKDNIILQQVNLNVDKIDRLEFKIDSQDKMIRYQESKYLQLLKQLDCKEPFGLNNLLFTYEELIEILKNKYHSLHNYISRWFLLDEECQYENGIYEEDNYELYFSEDAIEVEQDGFWLVNLKTDYAVTFKNLDELNRKIYELEKGEDNES